VRILVVYYITSEARLQTEWADGFAAGARRLSDDNETHWYNLAVDGPDQIDARRNYDFVLAKSNWGWHVDRFVRRELAGTAVRRGIAISGSARLPSAKRARFYDVLFYETDWYRPYVESHPRVYHAFGVNTDIMNPSVQQAEKQYDWMTVGAFQSHKRQWLILNKPGKKLAVGDVGEADPDILRQLRAGGVEIHDYVSQERLATLYGQARYVYVPATLHGGGERALMEAQACGTPVAIEPDNPKLAELLARPEPWSHHYYGDQLAKGISAAMEAPGRTRLARTQDWLLEKIPDRRAAATRLAGLRERMGKQR